MAAKKPAKVPVEKGSGRGAREDPASWVKPTPKPAPPSESITLPFVADEGAVLFDPSCQTCGNPVKWDVACACCGTIAVKVK